MNPAPIRWVRGLTDRLEDYKIKTGPPPHENVVSIDPRSLDWIASNIRLLNNEQVRIQAEKARVDSEIDEVTTALREERLRFVALARELGITWSQTDE